MFTGSSSCHRKLLVYECFNQYICLNLFNFCKCVFSTAGTSNTKSDNIVDPDVYSPAIEKLGESSFSERNFKEKNIGMGSNQKCNDSYITLENKDSLPSIDLEKPSLEESSQDIKESLGFNDLHERPNSEDSVTIESPQVNL